MRHTMDLLIADKCTNNVMRCADLKPNYKCFINDVRRVSFETTSTVDEEYILNLIEKSKSTGGNWFPAIRFNGRLYVSPGIKEISDGKKIFFC